MAAYGGRDDGLFVGAIPHSPFFPTHRTIAQSESQFDLFVNATGCTGADADIMPCLRSKDIATIQAANIKEPLPGATGIPLFYFTPVIDGDFSRDYLYSQLEKGEFVKVPTMVAGTSDEGTYFAANASSPEEVSVFLKNNYPRLQKRQLSKINQLYPLTDPLPEHAAYFPSAAAAYGNSTFTCGGKLVSEAVAKYVSPKTSWNYRYNVVDPDLSAQGLGVPHAVDTPAIFGVGFAGGEGTSLETTDAGVVPIVMDYYLSFVQTLDPNTLKNSTAPVWDPIYGADGHGPEERLKIETVGSVMEAVPQDQIEGCDYWVSIYRIMQQ
jgi:acetylcholinesterase